MSAGESRVRRPGFILIETVVAMAVLSVTILGVHRGISQALTARARTMDFTVARFLLEEKLNELLLQPQLTVSQDSGTFAAPHERFSFSWTVKRIDLPTPEIPPTVPPERRQFVEKQLQKYIGKIEIKIAWERSGQAFERTGETLIGKDKLWQPPDPAGAV